MKCPRCSHEIVRFGDIGICFSAACIRLQPPKASLVPVEQGGPSARSLRPPPESGITFDRIDRKVISLEGVPRVSDPIGWFGDRRGYFFARQGERCYLGITHNCKAAGQMMRLSEPHAKMRGRDATWEHLNPKAKGGSKRTTLLACAECNHAKGARVDIVKPEEFEMSKQLAREWREISMRRAA